MPYEFGSSPTLLDDMLANPVLMDKWIDSIPDVADIDIGPRRFGDLCKIGGVHHIWSGSRWLRVEDANRLIAIGMRCH